MWEDATYNQMKEAVERQNAEVPHFIEPENRLSEYDLAQRTGGNLLVVNDMVNNMKSQLVQEEEDKIMRSLMRIPGMTGERALEILRRYKVDKDAKAIEGSLSTPGLAKVIDEVMVETPEMSPEAKEEAMLTREIIREEVKNGETERLKKLRAKLVRIRSFGFGEGGRGIGGAVGSGRIAGGEELARKADIVLGKLVDKHPDTYNPREEQPSYRKSLLPPGLVHSSAERIMIGVRNREQRNKMFYTDTDIEMTPEDRALAKAYDARFVSDLRGYSEPSFKRPTKAISHLRDKAFVDSQLANAFDSRFVSDLRGITKPSFQRKNLPPGRGTMTTGVPTTQVVNPTSRTQQLIAEMNRNFDKLDASQSRLDKRIAGMNLGGSSLYQEMVREQKSYGK